MLRCDSLSAACLAAQAIRSLAEELGEENLFIGHGEAQLSSAEFPLPGLFEVSGVDTAMKAIEEAIVSTRTKPFWKRSLGSIAVVMVWILPGV